MLRNVADLIRNITAFFDIPEGDIRRKVYKEPLFKPPRRNPSVCNKSNRSDYMKNYMRDYREQGKDYQKIPEKVKIFRRQQRKRFKEKLRERNPLKAYLLDQEASAFRFRYKTEIPVGEFKRVCSHHEFTDDEVTILLEDLYDSNLILC